MMEIGDYTEDGHKLVGAKIAELKIDYLVAVGQRAKFMTVGAKEAGLAESNIFQFDNTKEASEFLLSKINNGDVVLVKGSQSMRMEKIVKVLIAEPERAKELLVRQGTEWEE